MSAPTHAALEALRAQLDGGFGDDTRAPGSAGTGAAGHCAAVAVIVRRLYGGAFVSAIVDGQSHWFNRVDGTDIDLTGDQFGRSPVQAADAGGLYEGTRVREPRDCRVETIERAFLLAQRAGVPWACASEVRPPRRCGHDQRPGGCPYCFGPGGA